MSDHPSHLAHKQFQDRNAPTPNIRFSAQWLSRSLFRRAISGGHARVTHQRTSHAGGRVWICGETGPCQPEVRNLGLPVRSHQYVAWFDVLMYQPTFMDRMQPPGELNGYVQDLVQGPELTLRDSGGQRSPFHIFGEYGQVVTHAAEETACS